MPGVDFGKPKSAAAEDVIQVKRFNPETGETNQISKADGKGKAKTIYVSNEDVNEGEILQVRRGHEYEYLEVNEKTDNGFTATTIEKQTAEDKFGKSIAELTLEDSEKTRKARKEAADKRLQLDVDFQKEEINVLDARAGQVVRVNGKEYTVDESVEFLTPNDGKGGKVKFQKVRGAEAKAIGAEGDFFTVDKESIAKEKVNEVDFDVGDSFTINGEEFEVSEKNENEVKLVDGITHTLEDFENINIDKGSLVKSGDKPEPTPAPEPEPAPAPAGNHQKQIADELLGLIEKNQGLAKVKIRSQDLFDIADNAYGGTMAQAAYTAKDAYEALELAVNWFILKEGEKFNSFKFEE